MTNGGISGLKIVYPDDQGYYSYRPTNEGTQADQVETVRSPGTQPTLETQDPDAALAEEIAKTVHQHALRKL